VLTISVFIVLLIVFYNTRNIFFIKSQNQLVAHNAKALVLSCIDFRLVDDMVYFLNSIGLNNNYDEYVLAGASLGYNQTKFAHWSEILNDHIDIALKLHKIKEIIVIDHMDCGAYKTFYDKPDGFSHDDEVILHKKNLKLFSDKIKAKYSDFTISTYIMNLDGTVIRN
jgi:carbonic anhydrase